jgi:GTP-binding protein Era
VKAKRAAGPAFKSGYVMLLGRPNVGKSTLLNGLLQRDLAIVTPKPQTTRQRILGILTTEAFQVVFLDTPGVVESERGLNAFLKREVLRALQDADLIVFVVDAGSPKQSEHEIIKRLATLNRPVVLAINKIDRVKKTVLLPLIDEYQRLFPFAAIVPICATRGDGLAPLLHEVVTHLATGPQYFPADQLTDATERLLVAEMVREQVFLKTRQEIPYSSAVLVEEFKDTEPLVRIRAVIFVERDGQKGILIGQDGAMLKAIGTAARARMEAFLGKHVFLELFVKVKRDWTRSASAMRELGYD